MTWPSPFACKSFQAHEHADTARFLKWLTLELLSYVAVALVVPVDWKDVGRSMVMPRVTWSTLPARPFRWRNRLALQVNLAKEFYAVVALAILGGGWPYICPLRSDQGPVLERSREWTRGRVQHGADHGHVQQRADHGRIRDRRPVALVRMGRDGGDGPRSSLDVLAGLTAQQGQDRLPAWLRKHSAPGRRRPTGQLYVFPTDFLLTSIEV
jgi:hypothetical protein